MRVLLICDDFYHPGQVPIEGTAQLKEHGFLFDVITDAKEFKTEMLEAYPVVILCKSDQASAQDKARWKTNDVQQAFISYVEKGGGLLAIHSATVAGEKTEKMDKLLGSRFTFHPLESPVTVKPITPHPITERVGMFCEVDELYRMKIISDDVDIIIASYSPPQGDPSKYEEEPVHNSDAWIDTSGYVRLQGKGRVCVLTPGHTLAVWQNPEFQKLLKNAIRWCAGQ